MNNQIWGILTIAFCVVCFGLSWTSQQKNNYGRALMLMMAGGFALRVFTAMDFFLHPWDEVFHAVVAKHLISHPLIPTLYENPVLPYSAENWAANHIWVHKQPLPLWAMAASMYLFGVNEIALRLPSLLLSTIGIWLTYYIGAYLFDRKTGYLAAFFFAINGLIIEMTAGRVPTDHIDVFFLFFIELSTFFTILFCQTKNTVYNILCGFSIGAAILCKWLPALTVLPVWILLVLDSEQFSLRSMALHFFILLVIVTLTFAPWQWYIYHAFPIEAKWEGNYNLRHLTEPIENHQEPFYYYFNIIRINYGELIYLPIIWLFYKIYLKPSDRRRIAICVWVFVPFIFFSLIKTKMQGYILFTSPALFLITADFWFACLDYKIKGKYIWLLNLIMLLLIALPLRYTIERVKPFSTSDRDPRCVADLRSLGQKKITKGVLFNYDKPIDAMFYTDLTVYPSLPDKQTIEHLIQTGYNILINDDGKVPQDILTIKGISICHLSS